MWSQFPKGKEQLLLKISIQLDSIMETFTKTETKIKKQIFETRIPEFNRLLETLGFDLYELLLKRCILSGQFLEDFLYHRVGRISEYHPESYHVLSAKPLKKIPSKIRKTETCIHPFSKLKFEELYSEPIDQIFSHIFFLNKNQIVFYQNTIYCTDEFLKYLDSGKILIKQINLQNLREYLYVWKSLSPEESLDFELNLLCEVHRYSTGPIQKILTDLKQDDLKLFLSFLVKFFSVSIEGDTISLLNSMKLKIDDSSPYGIGTTERTKNDYIYSIKIDKKVFQEGIFQYNLALFKKLNRPHLNEKLDLKSLFFYRKKLTVRTLLQLDMICKYEKTLSYYRDEFGKYQLIRTGKFNQIQFLMILLHLIERRRKKYGKFIPILILYLRYIYHAQDSSILSNSEFHSLVGKFVVNHQPVIIYVDNFVAEYTRKYFRFPTNLIDFESIEGDHFFIRFNEQESYLIASYDENLNRWESLFHWSFRGTEPDPQLQKIAHELHLYRLFLG